MALYCGIDLHSNNNYICVIDDKDKRLFERKLDNDIDQARIQVRGASQSMLLTQPYDRSLTCRR